ncbi:MAG: hypothetical protein ACK46Q_16365 [Hyphomonas sp.]
MRDALEEAFEAGRRAASQS